MAIDKTYELPFPLGVVYGAWVSSDTVVPPASRMDIDPVVGGHYKLFVDTPDGVVSCIGKFATVEPQHHLVYSWEWNNDGEVSEIDVRFAETETGTRLRLQHDGFKKAESETNHDSGWDNYIKGLIELLVEKSS
ncbi:MAG: SRPBCC domain-containing protein [Stappiaceae bacterium]